jgi:hypothetical protein
MMWGMHRTTGLLAIALLLATVFFLSLPGGTAWQRVTQDAGHGPVFAAIAVIALLLQRPRVRMRLPGMYWRAFVVALALGIATELIQRFQPNRTVSLLDVLHDAAGAALGLALYALGSSTTRLNPGPTEAAVASAGPLPRPVLWCIVLGALALLAWQPLQCARAYAERKRAFPTLLQAASGSDLYFTQARNASLQRSEVPAAWRTAQDGTAVRLEYGGRRPALEIGEPAPDWRGHDRLMLDLVNPGDQPLEFVLRILDAHHDWSHEDRFNMPVVIPAASRVTVQVSLAAVASAPARRRMDMAAIKNVMLFAPAPLPGTEFYVPRIWLQ